VASSPVEKCSWRLALRTPAFLICSCGAAQILAPIGSTENTRYTCRRCCALIVRRRNIESLLAFRHGRARPNEVLSGRALVVIEDFG
jgi:hypothetical protein